MSSWVLFASKEGHHAELIDSASLAAANCCLASALQIISRRELARDFRLT